MTKRLVAVAVFLISFCSAVVPTEVWALTPAESNKQITVLVFSSYSCPYCDKARPMLASINAKYPGRVRIIFKHFPMSSDEKSLLPHEAAEAAAAQGKFQAMHDALYDAGVAKQDRKAVEKIAQQLGLNMASFRADLDKHLGRAHIEDDVAEAGALKVVATPTFFIDGYKLEGLQLQETLEQLIEHQMAKK